MIPMRGGERFSQSRFLYGSILPLAGRDRRHQAAKPLVCGIAVHTRVPNLDVAERHEFDRRPQQSGPRDFNHAVREPFRQREYQVGVLDYPSSGGEIRSLQLDAAAPAHFFECPVDDALALMSERHHRVRKRQIAVERQRLFSNWVALANQAHEIVLEENLDPQFTRRRIRPEDEIERV